uniref:B box-type domain-containing protein n=1 Tax=Macrostomum lignano TaxID=282301 RepID=A0A1I8G2U7_9PLAT
MRRTRCSVRFCEERANCDTDQAIASVRCDQCGSDQCVRCDEAIHSATRLSQHDRVAIPESDSSELCQHVGCRRAVNYADVYCTICQRNFCYDCDAKEHKQAGRSHSRKSFAQRRADLALLETDNIGVVAAPTATNSNRFNSNSPPSRLGTEPEPDDDEFSDAGEMNSTNADGVDKFYSLSAPVAGTIITDQPARTSWSRQSPPQHDTIPSPPPLPAPIAARLIDSRERLLVDSGAKLCDLLDCPEVNFRRLPVVSIVGKTGDGKSHTLNFAFFNGSSVFHTSDDPLSCTVGVWAALGRNRQCLLLDTEGLQGAATSVACRQVSLLLKVLAISDIVIYRARCERLQDDAFAFLSDASRAFVDVLRPALIEKSGNRSGAYDDCEAEGEEVDEEDTRPALLVFHETRHTRTLGADRGDGKEDEDDSGGEAFRRRYAELGCHSDGFSRLDYVGVRSSDSGAGGTNFEPLRHRIDRLLASRRGRKPDGVVKRLRLLSERFKADASRASLPDTADVDMDESVDSAAEEYADAENFVAAPGPQPAEYFTCQTRCLSCQAKCSQAQGHAGGHAIRSAGPGAAATAECRQYAQLDNRQYICLSCERTRGKRSVAAYILESGLTSYALHGYALTCSLCGVLQRSRQYWYGNQDPVEAGLVRAEFVHVWPNGEAATPDLQSSLNAGQRLLEGVSYAFGTVSAVAGAALPTRAVADYISDSIAPAKWVPNSTIKECKRCQTDLAGIGAPSKHHCRACGQVYRCFLHPQGFCDPCSSRRVPVIGYGPDPVRVCIDCADRSPDQGPLVAPDDGTRLRQYSELVSTACTAVITGAAGAIKSYARPSYWQPDHLAVRCAVCRTEFNPPTGLPVPLHHCRLCGLGVCDACSRGRAPVPSRGWESSVRVCDKCVQSAA